MSMGGAKYFVTFGDDFWRKVWIYMMKSKGEWFDRFKEFQTFVETQLEYELKVFWWMSRSNSIWKKI